MKLVATAAAAVGLFASLPAPATAAELAMLASAAIDVILNEAVPQFERASGNKVAMRLDYAALLRKEIEAGAAFDVTILVGSLDGLVKDGKLSSAVALGRTGYGVAVRAGAPKPDISTADAFKTTMLNAKSVTYAKDGGSGAYFVRLLDRLGIAEPMKPRLHPSSNPQELVAKGEVEITVNGIVPILRSPGIVLVGPLPGELQSASVFNAGVSAGSSNADAAKALVSFLKSPASVAIFKKHGVEPL
jgi:molybdate transport system substrate-binding protein